MPTIFQSFRHLRRYDQIGRIVTRYGFGHILTQLGIGRAITPGLERLRSSSSDILRATPAERMRMAVEELGPTFIKLGQILSTRGDLLPVEYIHELEKLQDTVPPTDFALIQAEVERELKKPLDEVFAAFDPVPVASASLGQVHLATLPSGQEVAVKVFRPGIDKVIDTDLEILLELADLAEKRTEWGEYYGVRALAQEFADTLRAERNYEQEGQNMDRYRQIFEGDEHVRIPFVYWGTTTKHVLTMERIQGIKITAVDALDAAGLDREVIASRNIAILLRAVLQEGFFHADPHAGNFMVLPGEVIAMMDFGIMGHLDRVERLGLMEFFVALFSGDTERTVDAMSALGIATKATDRRHLIRDLERLRLRYYGLDLERIRARSFIEDLMGIALSYRLKMPTDLVLVFKTIAMLEGISVKLDPDMNVFQEVEPYVRDAILELQSPVVRLREAIDQMREASEAMMLLPKQLQRILEQIEAGESNLGMTMRGLDEPVRRITGAANRLVLALLAVAFVVGPALIIPRLGEILPEWRLAATLLIGTGFAMSLFLTFVLVLSIWRSGR